MGLQEVADRTVKLANNDDRNGNIPLTESEYSELRGLWKEVGNLGLYSLSSRLTAAGVDASIVDALTKKKSYGEYCDLASLGI